MDSSDATWAPQSPDLSNDYYSADSTTTTTTTAAAAVYPPHHQGYRGSLSHATPYSPPASSPIRQPKQAPFMPRGVKKEESMQDADYLPDAPDAPTVKSRGKRAAKEGNGTTGLEGATTATTTTITTLPGTDIVIRNHFPVARIKRIMQADDDVGKVAQVTPVVVSKALELFMISLVTKAAAEAKARNSKRVATIHLKQAITKDEQFDFLSEIVAKVADAPAAAEKHEGDAMEVDGKKRKASGRRKKKADDDDF